MAGPPATVTGAEEAARAYAAIAADARNMTEAHRRIASAGADAARARAPVRTGRLAGSIDGRGTERDATLTVAVAYWPYVEFGTRWIEGRRFARAGIDAMHAAAPDAYRDRMAAVIEAHT